MCIEIGDIDNDCAGNAGGLVDSLYVAHKNDIDSIPTAVAGIVTADITMKATKKFAKWDFLEDSGKLTNEAVGDKGSTSLKSTIVVRVKGGTNSIDAMLNQLVNGKFVVIAVLPNGEKRIVGNTQRGARLMPKYDSGAKGEDAHIQEITFDVVTPHGALPYTGEIPTA